MAVVQQENESKMLEIDCMPNSTIKVLYNGDSSPAQVCVCVEMNQLRSIGFHIKSPLSSISSDLLVYLQNSLIKSAVIICCDICAMR